MSSVKPIKKLLCANRGEIAIRVFRACTELGIRTVAIYSNEDRVHEHRHKADEAYLVGRGKKPVDAYLGIDEILSIAKHAEVDAIHPGYGFLSENPDFAEACEKQGIRFIGPSADVIRLMGDKVRAKELATKVGIPAIPSMALVGPSALRDARSFLDAHGALLVKAAHGGGGRGMRVVRTADELESAIQSAQSESKSAFGSDVVFLEKYLERVRHIEVQLLGDLHGHLMHLHERDCSVQRRYQKLIEIAPAPNLDGDLKTRICDAALALGKAARYSNAGTVEFLVNDQTFFFIEVNPRLQVEHTVTEQVTGVDIVQAQLRIAEGYPIAAPETGIPAPEKLATRGYAVQLRITTEDPSNNFLPDAGTIQAWRPATGFGIRLDGGNGYVGAQISPHYDSLLVKVIAFAGDFEAAVLKARRAVKEFRIRGVKTNLPFIENVLEHPAFLGGQTWTRFIDETSELFNFVPRRDRASKFLQYLADIIVNGHPTIKKEDRRRPSEFVPPRMPAIPKGAPPPGTAQILSVRGPEGLAKWVLEQRRPLLTDTTMRDAHQSLLATRMRTYDILAIAPAMAHLAHDLFSLETWGGATFDTAYRFLHEDPWARLRAIKAACPNVLQQMLLRGANAVGYTSYPDNVVEAFIDEAAEAGIDVFRVFDSLNDLESMRVSVNRIRKTGKVAEVALCYSGDVSNPNRSKYTLEYYVEMARRIEGMGAHFLCIKDMAGLLRPRAAGLLLDALRKEISIPIHLHTHDTSGNGVAALLTAIEHGANIVDVAVSSMAGLTSQPSMNALVSALRGYPRDTMMQNKRLQPLADYWEDVREYYSPFECGLKSCTSEVYFHEIPGGQYSNLRPQVAEMGLLHRWNDVKYAFALVNLLVGDIPKVTPSSKMVGDFAIFILKNDLMVKSTTLEDSAKATEARLIQQAPHLDFPSSVVGYFQGHLGNPPGGFPAALREAVLKGLPIVHGRPSAALEPLDLDSYARDLEKTLSRPVARCEAVSHALYPRVLDDFFAARKKYEDLSVLDSATYFYGLDQGQEVWIEMEPGKTLVLCLQTVSEPDAHGMRTVYFELNGHGRQVTVRDHSKVSKIPERQKADKNNNAHVSATMPGIVIAIHCGVGEQVTAGSPLLTLEAMKMETVVRAQQPGIVREIVPSLKSSVHAGDLLATVSP